MHILDTAVHIPATAMHIPVRMTIPVVFPMRAVGLPADAVAFPIVPVANPMDAVEIKCITVSRPYALYRPASLHLPTAASVGMPVLYHTAYLPTAQLPAVDETLLLLM